MPEMHRSKNHHTLSACAAFLLAIPASAGESGKMTREMWGNLPGSQLSAFTDSPRL